MTYLAGDDQPRAHSTCIFCHKLDAPDEAEHVVHRGCQVYVTLNKFPYNNGHLLVVPAQHVPSPEELDAETLTELMLLANRSLAALRAIYHPDGFNMGMNLGLAAGAGVAEHVHLHIVPRWNGDTSFMPVVGETRVLPETLDQTYARVRQAFEAM
ncbi:MAG: HIT domain-containing protein [Thermoflexales bacterium]|nr:HIT domain-containing protein [Thermoflexales bacterium]